MLNFSTLGEWFSYLGTLNTDELTALQWLCK